jgi:hypothetical protein
VIDEDSSDSEEDIEKELEVGSLPTEGDEVPESEEQIEEEAIVGAQHRHHKPTAAHGINAPPPTMTPKTSSPKSVVPKESPLRIHSDCTRFTNAAAATDCINVCHAPTHSAIPNAFEVCCFLLGCAWSTG